MISLETVISTGVLATGGTGIIVLIGLFIRQLVSNTSKSTAKNDAEINILNIWKVERDALRALTEELQKERFELMSKLTQLQGQLQNVQDQLASLIKDKCDLMEQVRQKELTMCSICNAKNNIVT